MDDQPILRAAKIFAQLQRYSTLAEVTFFLGLHDKTKECLRGVAEQAELVNSLFSCFNGDQNAKEESHDATTAEADPAEQSGSKTVP